jgi:hydroxyethylthiazole kinase-like uncharacterized protein yjeF
MIGVHTVADIRAAETALMATLPPGTLMQRAAAGLAATCGRILGRLYGAQVTVLVGSGNNGADALWAGARMAGRGAHTNAILLSPDRTDLEALAAFRSSGGRIVAGDSAGRVLAKADLVLDGIIGIGGRSGLTEQAAQWSALARNGAGLIVAVDLPSGIDPDTGEAPGAHVVADVTVTFGAYKTALVIDPAAAAAGMVRLVDIGLVARLPAARINVLEASDVAGLLPDPGRESDKYSRGVVGVLAGSSQYPGAAILAAGGAVRGGAGMVRYAGPDVVTADVRSRWPEVIASADPASTGRVQAWTVGSGLGAERADHVATVLRAGVPVVVDADALRSLPSRMDSPAVLTPHAGELARMLGVDRSEVQARRLHFAREAARRWNATVLLKGTTTLVAAADGRVRVNLTGTSALATAGTGDVLAGLVGSLMAAGLDPFDAASVGAYLHGLAGRRAVKNAAYPSAGDVLDQLPVVLSDSRCVRPSKN